MDNLSESVSSLTAIFDIVFSAFSLPFVMFTRPILSLKLNAQQVCIPVGCVPTAASAAIRCQNQGGVCTLGGCAYLLGGCVLPGVPKDHTPPR